MKEDDYQKQIIIANSLYEMGIDYSIIQEITTVSSKDLQDYRKKDRKQTKNIDKSKQRDI